MIFFLSLEGWFSVQWYNVCFSHSCNDKHASVCDWEASYCYLTCVYPAPQGSAWWGEIAISCPIGYASLSFSLLYCFLIPNVIKRLTIYKGDWKQGLWLKKLTKLPRYDGKPSFLLEGGRLAQTQKGLWLRIHKITTLAPAVATVLRVGPGKYLHGSSY